jgi:hypothetical protein
MRGRSSDRSARSRSVHRSTGRPVGSPQRLVAAQSLVENVRLAALCGLLRCEIAEDPKGNRRRRSMRRMPRELASGSSEKWRRPVSTGVRIPGSEPAANTDDRSGGGPSQYILRTIWRTNSTDSVGSFRQEHSVWQRCHGAVAVQPTTVLAGPAPVPTLPRWTRAEETGPPFQELGPESHPRSPPFWTCSQQGTATGGNGARLMRTKPVEDDGHSWR